MSCWWRLSLSREPLRYVSLQFFSLDPLGVKGFSISYVGGTLDPPCWQVPLSPGRPFSVLPACPPPLVCLKSLTLLKGQPPASVVSSFLSLACSGRRQNGRGSGRLTQRLAAGKRVVLGSTVCHTLSLPASTCPQGTSEPWERRVLYRSHRVEVSWSKLGGLTVPKDLNSKPKEIPVTS